MTSIGAILGSVPPLVPIIRAIKTKIIFGRLWFALDRLTLKEKDLLMGLFADDREDILCWAKL